MNDEPEYSNDPKEFDETPLFFGDAETSSEDQYETHDSYPSDYEADAEPAGDSEFVIPFASNDAPANATATADDVPQMPLYEAPSYVPPTYPTNSDTPVGYEDTGVYARGSYTVDEDEASPIASQFVQPRPEATPVSPFVNVGADPYGADPAYVNPAYDEPTQEMPAVSEADYDPYAAGDSVQDAEPQYDFDNPPPSVADLFDVTPSAAPVEPAASSIPAYMQQGEAVRPGSVPGVTKRPSQPQRPGNRPNTQPTRRRPDTIDDGFDSEDDGQAGTFLPYVLAAVSLICLIIIIVLIAKSCGSSKKSEPEDTSSDVSISDVSGEVTDTTPSESETTPPATETTSATDPIGIYTFSDTTGCRTWWDLFHYVYGLDIESENDPLVTTLKTYNNLDASYQPKAGESVKLPPPSMFPPKTV